MATPRSATVSSSDLQRYVPYAVGKNSDGLGWRGVRAEIVRGHGPGEISLPALDHHLLNLIVRAPTLHEHRWDGRGAEEIGREGAASLVPAGCESYWRWTYLTPESACDFHVHLKPSFVRRIATDDRRRGEIVADLRGSLCFYEPSVQHLGALLMQEVDGSSRNGPLFAESIATALVLILLRGPESAREGGDTKTRSWPLSTTREMCEFIEEHLGEGLHLEALAERMETGPVTFAREFRKAMGSSPYQYVLTRRVARAKEMLRGTTMSLSDIALQLGFFDHAHFASTFRRRVGVAPSVFRAQACR